MNIKNYFKTGEAYVWLNAGSVTICLLMIVGILTLIGSHGLKYFWPADIMSATYTENGQTSQVLGEVVDKQSDLAKVIRENGTELPATIKDTSKVERLSIKMGNKGLSVGPEFKWFVKPLLTNVTYPKDAYRFERTENGKVFAYLDSVTYKGQTYTGEAAKKALHDLISNADDVRNKAKAIQGGDLYHTVTDKNDVENSVSLLKYKHLYSQEKQASAEKLIADLDAKAVAINEKITQMTASLDADKVQLKLADGSSQELPASTILAAEQPNSMNVFSKSAAFVRNLWQFVSQDPRESNTEGGVFPAIVGTVLMVFIMTLIVTPLGVVAAVYLREYAKQGRFTQLVRIGINNLAGVPSIVYGIFGLGFFVNTMGSTVDQLLYPELFAEHKAVFNKGGLLWASLTLALLTLPVVIVAAEEGLTRIPRSLKEGSLALGATKAETLWKVVLPMAAPAIMTGMILAIARAAGEVAPLMLVGVVKTASELPIDLYAPFLHLDRSFVHLGYNIYDVGFKSPDSEKARPLVYATAFLLVFVVAVLNMAAIAIRNRLREKYKALEH